MKKILTVIVVGLLVIGCSEHATDPTSKVLKTFNPNNYSAEVYDTRADPAHILADEYASAIDYSFMAAHTQFALKSFKEIEDAEPSDQNIFFSPLSLQIALTMMFNGAEGSTYDAMARTLEFQDFTLAEINGQFLNLVRSLDNADHSVSFHNANSAWIDIGFPVFEDYQQRIIDYFSAQVENIDLQTAEAIEIINNWASEHTGGQITEIISQPISADVVLYLINALYFAGEWIYEFDPRLTFNEKFYLLDGTYNYVPMMTNKGKDYLYYFDENFHAARMPYGRNIFAMYVFLPVVEQTVDDFIDNLNTQDWEDWMYSFEPLQHLVDHYTYIQFRCKYPKYRFGYDIYLNDILSDLGMGIAFSGSANFHGLTQSSLWISLVKQKTFIQVDEYGTVASGITIVEGSGSPGPPPMEFIVDRPFFFVIQDDRTGAILFMGKIVDPVYE